MGNHPNNNIDGLLKCSLAKRLPNEKVFLENSSYPRHRLKERIIHQNLIPYMCEQCSIVDTYNDISIVLELDHINGINNDNRIINLRFLCPNCHSQQKTNSGKNKNYRRIMGYAKSGD